MAGHGKSRYYQQRPSRIGAVLKHVFRLRAWLDVVRIRTFYQYLLTNTRSLFIPTKPEPDQTKSFNEMVKQLQLSQEDLNKQARALWCWSVLLLLIALSILFMVGYHGIHGHWRASILSLLVAMVGMMASFRYHFLYFQIKTKQLGCSFGDWFRATFMRMGG